MRLWPTLGTKRREPRASPAPRREGSWVCRACHDVRVLEMPLRVARRHRLDEGATRRDENVDAVRPDIVRAPCRLCGHREVLPTQDAEGAAGRVVESDAVRCVDRAPEQGERALGRGIT